MIQGKARCRTCGGVVDVDVDEATQDQPDVRITGSQFCPLCGAPLTFDYLGPSQPANPAAPEPLTPMQLTRLETAPQPAAAPAAAAPGGPVEVVDVHLRISQEALALAFQHGVNVLGAVGSGPDGLVIASDIQALLEPGHKGG